MSTGTEIIKDALQKIGAHSVATPANPEAIEAGRKALNSMCEMWLSEGIRFGFTPLKVPGDDLNEPADARNGIVFNLAIMLAPDFGKDVSSNLNRMATTTFAKIRNIYEVVTVPDRVVSSTLPKGQGNHESFGSDQTFFRDGETVSG